MTVDVERVNKLEETVNILEKSVVNLDATMAARIRTEVQLEQTLRNIDDNIHVLNEKIIHSPVERGREMKEELDPVYKQLRQHEDIFMRRRDVIAFLLVIVFFLTTFSVMGSYILLDGKGDLIKGQQANKLLIEKNATNLSRHHIINKDEVYP